MSIDPDKLPGPVDAMIEKVDLALSLLGENPLKTAALAIIVGRRIAYESGGRKPLDEGLDIMCAMLRRAASVEARKLYGKG
jgi:hypothetical protein